MSLSVALMVLAAGFLHAAWNAILKSQPDQFAGLFAQLAAVFIIGLAGVLWTGVLPREAWPWLAGGMLAHLTYHCCLAATYKRCDISLAYPILRGAAPPLATLGALILWQETPTIIETAGIVAISSGILLTAKTRGANTRGLGYALITALSIACYSLTDAAGARVSGDPVQYLFWLMMLDALFFMPVVMLSSGRRQLLFTLPLKCWLLGAVGGVFSVAAYGLALFAYTQAQIGAVAALRETSILFAVFLGIFFLREQASFNRLFGALLITSGAILIVV